jgi:mitochondrial fission protein ELM1
MADPRIWALSEGHAGMASQVRGLAAATGLGWEERVADAGPAWRRVPKALWPARLDWLGGGAAKLAPPWPAGVISCGGAAARIALAIRNASGGGTRLVHVQDPRVARDRFDLLVVPRHDRVPPAPNVIETRAAVHPVTKEKLAAAAETWRARFAGLRRPLVAVLVGGSNGRHRLTPAIAERLANQLASLADGGAGIALTTSRRTDPACGALLAGKLAPRGAFVWTGDGENPYLGMLALADAILATEDSVSMVSEACATGKPVHWIELEGRSRRIAGFLAGLEADGVARPFAGRLATWRYDPPDDTARAAAEIVRRFGW